MVCPVDGTALVIADRQGIEIDYCPQCRGVWLDRGELDKLIERTTSYAGGQREEQRGYEDRDRSHDRGHDYDRRDSDDHHDGHKKRKREGFMGELFDFGD